MRPLNDASSKDRGTRRPRIALSKGRNFLFGDTLFRDTWVPGGLLNLGKGILLSTLYGGGISHLLNGGLLNGQGGVEGEGGGSWQISVPGLDISSILH
jgi:hypothetical protein